MSTSYCFCLLCSKTTLLWPLCSCFFYRYIFISPGYVSRGSLRPLCVLLSWTVFHKGCRESTVSHSTAKAKDSHFFFYNSAKSHLLFKNLYYVKPLELDTSLQLWFAFPWELLMNSYSHACWASMHLIQSVFLNLSPIFFYFFNDLFFLTYVYVCLSECRYVHMSAMSTEARRGH